jgi:hypothetical protein
MATHKTLMAYVLILMLTGIAYAQESKALPSEIDLRAAYCIPIAQHLVSLMEEASKLISRPEKNTSTEVNNALTGAHNDLRRLQLYLLPRIAHLQMLGIAAALQRGKEDLIQVEEYGKTCAAKCQHLEHARNSDPWMACLTRCNQGNPLNSRLKTCSGSELGWLPY